MDRRTHYTGLSIRMSLSKRIPPTLTKFLLDVFSHRDPSLLDDSQRLYVLAPILKEPCNSNAFREARTELITLLYGDSGSGYANSFMRDEGTHWNIQSDSMGDVLEFHTAWKFLDALAPYILEVGTPIAEFYRDDHPKVTVFTVTRVGKVRVGSGLPTLPPRIFCYH